MQAGMVKICLAYNIMKNLKIKKLAAFKVASFLSKQKFI